MSTSIHKLTVAALLAASPLLILSGCNKDAVKVAEDTQPPAMQEPVNEIPSTGIPEAMYVADATTQESTAEGNDVSLTMTESEPDTQGESDMLQQTDTPMTDAADSTQTITESQAPLEHEVRFGFDQTSIDSQYDEMLKQHARFLIDNPQLVLEIKGHTDSNGPKAYNQYLSKQRADAVAKRLVDYGVPVSRIHTDGVADDEPLVSASSNREQRRVELFYQDSHLVSN